MTSVAHKSGHYNTDFFQSEAEFIDGMRFSVQSGQALTMNVDLKQGVNPGTLPSNTQSLNSFMWVVNTSAPLMKVDAQMLVPCRSTFPRARIAVSN